MGQWVKTEQAYKGWYNPIEPSLYSVVHHVHRRQLTVQYPRAILRTHMPVGKALTNVLYPPACLLCHGRLSSPEEVLCGNCVKAMPRSEPPVCVRCGVGIPGAFDALMPCATCRKKPPAFEQARAPWRYAGAVQEAIQQFKYRRRWRIGRWLAEEMARVARSSFPLDEEVFVASVPLHWIKRRLNGFNPAEDLARVVAHALEKPYDPRALRRIRWTPTQTRLSSAQRIRNVRGAFASNHHRSIRNRTVLLIDDVLTSGATANACAAALKEAGAGRVLILTAARTPLLG